MQGRSPAGPFPADSLPGMTDSDLDSLFLRIIAGEIPADVVHDSERVLAIRDINPQAPTHVLVVPKTRYRNAAELATAEPDLLAELVRVAGEVAEREGIAESGYRLLFNTNEDAGQTIFHVHLHLLGGEPLGGLTGGPIKG
ncbi:histidine triad nucleotide-binding protein [Saccharopolyspora gregorii]|uniref:Histidine triad nucleotide-binding protein n=2 Tax=Saccharopolyspora gregorii TaxID=33914 RepID=A0ABP6RWP0_9PSEU